MSKLENITNFKDWLRKNVPNEGEINTLLDQLVNSKFSNKNNSQSVSDINDIQIGEEPPLTDLNFKIDLPEDILKSINIILCDLSDEDSSLCYIPMLYPIGAYLLFNLNLNQVKAVLYHLLKLPDMLQSSKHSWNVFCQSSLKTIEKFAGKFSKLLKNNFQPEELFFWPYIIWNMFPKQFLQQFLFSFLVEGEKIYYRVLIMLCRESFHFYQSSEDVKYKNLHHLFGETIQHIQKTYTVDQFRDKLFNIKMLSRNNLIYIKANTSKALITESVLDKQWILPTPERKFMAFKLNEKSQSEIIDNTQFIAILKQLPPTIYQTMKPYKVFSTSSNGFNLATFYKIAENHEKTILLIKTMHGEIFGCFTLNAWKLSGRKDLKLSYGTGESFIFQIQAGQTRFYKWQLGNESIFQIATHDNLSLGMAFTLDKSFDQCHCATSKTFGLTELLAEDDDFKVQILELYTFKDITI